MSLRSQKDSFHTTDRPPNHGAQYFRLQPQVARILCTGVDDDSEDVTLESSNFMHINILAASRRLNGFGSFLNFAVDKETARSIFTCNVQDLADIV